MCASVKPGIPGGRYWSVGRSGSGSNGIPEAGQRAAVDRVVDGPAETDVAERPPMRVEDEEIERQLRVGEVLLPTPLRGRRSPAPYTRGEPLASRRPHALPCEVRSAGLDLSHGLVIRDADRSLDAAGSPRTAAVVVRIPLQDDPLPGSIAAT